MWLQSTENNLNEPGLGYNGSIDIAYQDHDRSHNNLDLVSNAHNQNQTYAHHLNEIALEHHSYIKSNIENMKQLQRERIEEYQESLHTEKQHIKGMDMGI